MNKRFGRFLLPLLMTALLFQLSMVASGQRSKGLLGRKQVLIINNSGRLLEVKARMDSGCWRFQLPAERDIILEKVKLIQVGGTDYSLEFKNRYALRWDEQGARPYVVRLVMNK